MRRLSHLLGLTLVAIGCSCGSPTSPSSGRVVWHVDGKGWGTPTFDDNAAYFVGYDHNLVAVEKHSGRVLWRARDGESGSHTSGRSAAVAGSVVVIGDLDIHAYDRATGAHRWDFHPTVGDSPGLYYLATDGQTIFAGSPSGHVYAIDANSGAQRWVNPIADDGNSGTFNPVYDQGVLFICLKHFSNPTSGGVVALDAQTGAILWATDLPPNPPFGGAACNLRVAVAGSLVVAASDAGKIYALDRTTGKMRWSAPQLSGLPPNAPGSPDADYRPLIARNGLVIAGSTTGYIVAYDASTGAERWRVTADRGSATYLLAADATAVYVTYSGLQLGAFDIGTGSLKWLAGDNPGGGEFYPMPAPDADQLYVSGLNGFYALRP